MSGTGVVVPHSQGVWVWFLLPFHELFSGGLGRQQIVLFLMNFRLSYLHCLGMAASLGLLSSCPLSVA